MSDPPPQSKPTLTGRIEARLGPRVLSGWVGCYVCGDVEDSAITVRNQGRVIGSGVANNKRPEAKTPPSVLRGFRITCDESISDAAIAFGDLVVEARDAAGHSTTLAVYSRLRATALMRILEQAPQADRLFATGILGWLAGSRAIPTPIITQLRACRDALLPPREVPAAGAAAAADPAAEGERQFWFRFESLGGDCTLGAVQRQARAEPLGLLRFAGSDVASIWRALRNDFAGVGSAEFTRIEPNGSGEYMSRDTRYHMVSHTFIYQGEMPFDRLFQQQCRKIAYLARNLLEDIIEGDKIFVAYDKTHPPEPVQVRRLHAAIRERGPGWLVHVQGLGAGSPIIGTAVEEGAGLISAYVGPAETPPAERQATWRAACSAAAAIVDASRSRTRVAVE